MVHGDLVCIEEQVIRQIESQIHGHHPANAVLQAPTLEKIIEISKLFFRKTISQASQGCYVLVVKDGVSCQKSFDSVCHTKRLKPPDNLVVSRQQNLPEEGAFFARRQETAGIARPDIAHIPQGIHRRPD